MKTLTGKGTEEPEEFILKIPGQHSNMRLTKI